MHMKPEAKRPWDRLAKALEDTVPACQNDDRYTEDTNTSADQQAMLENCMQCPLLDLCASFAASDKPIGGWWPGHNLKTHARRAVA